MPIDHQHAEELFCVLIARRLAGDLNAEEAVELDELFRLYPGLRLKADLLEAMFTQERERRPGPEAQEAYVRHWLRYREELQAGPALQDDHDPNETVNGQSPEP